MRRCSYCGQYGHYRPTCPELQVEPLALASSFDDSPLDQTLLHFIIEEQTSVLRHGSILASSFDDSPLDQTLLNVVIEEDTSVLRHGETIVESDHQLRREAAALEAIIRESVDSNVSSVRAAVPPPDVPYTSCVICMEDLTTQPKTELMCRHAFCTKCIMANVEHGNLECPMCRDVVMGPSKKVVELEDTIREQHEELCVQDDKLEYYEARFKSYDQEIKDKKKTIQDNKNIIRELNHSFSLDNLTELQGFAKSLSAEYVKFQHEYGEHSPSLACPTLKGLIYSLFTKKATRNAKFSAALDTTYKDIRGQLLTHDSWVKIVFGEYKNYMGRFMWKNYANNKGKYIIRVYLGLGKPKLGKGIYDSSYTTDIDFLTTDNLSMKNVCCVCIPNDVVHYQIQGNGTRLDKEIKQMLDKQKIQILLERV
tara:strand:- start:47 stop:1318 length:1272 start_codon:yes stop_codon:yes gene_type:complete